jgi:predicted secreted protein
VVATDADNGKTITIKVGQRLEIRLSSTYWVFGSSSNIAVLRSAGPQVASPQPSGCVPGGGCGVVTATFDAIRAGQADVTAARTSCGEALRCTAEQSKYRLTVSVA